MWLWYNRHGHGHVRRVPAQAPEGGPHQCRPHEPFSSDAYPSAVTSHRLPGAGWLILTGAVTGSHQAWLVRRPTCQCFDSGREVSPTRRRCRVREPTREVPPILSRPAAVCGVGTGLGIGFGLGSGLGLWFGLELKSGFELGLWLGTA